MHVREWAPHPRADRHMDPWYDYLALPVAPIVLAVQIAALFLRRRGSGVVHPPRLVAIAAMAAYVSSLPDRPDEGVNIGAGIFIVWLLASIGLLGVAAVREVSPLVLRSVRQTRSGDRQNRRAQHDASNSRRARLRRHEHG
jgi:hypothetical protein